jgi:hypothetical protein
MQIFPYLWIHFKRSMYSKKIKNCRALTVRSYFMIEFCHPLRYLASVVKSTVSFAVVRLYLLFHKTWSLISNIAQHALYLIQSAE